ncbi:DNA (cytosine-5-)-methyltransferase [Anaerococcus degeneri]|uniref:Cytosine-specific methyltransferase n=1 Tax=Anaerococcus degeneri TaxID=361500 RepID=A0ABS7YYT8_9FIRM|nr:DNA (cytosine-5-)-methyltransferase [Anaerococcus degeneri]MBP2015396.1 DNA (cytosine-5)-methyltransferase 1 [Anaerococcus degeneri]MCA2096289.1 DNA (cytosine-5-)-methyltransferase [Anaerococcus degeneri]
MKLRVVELFAGVGGFRVGLNDINSFDNKTGRAIENRDWEFVWANQFEPAYKTQDAFDCYIKRFGREDVSNIDINLVDKKEIPDHNLLVGGFPCQDYSVARSLSNEQGIEGKKGVLFWQIRDTLIEKKTPFVLLENVDRLLKSPASRRGRDFAVMLKTLDDLGYNLIWRVINAANYGMPQKRRRVFIFAFKKDSKYSKSLEKHDLSEIVKTNFINRRFLINIEEKENKVIDLKSYKDIADVSETYKNGKFFETGVMINQEIFTSELDSIGEEIYPLSRILLEANYFNSADLSDYVVEDEKLKKWEYLKGSKKIKRTNKQGHEYYYSEGAMSFPEDLNSPARTMLTSEGTVNRSSHIIFDENINKYRIITEVEAELIQMFPPNWTDTMPKRRRYFMMGNALVTGIINRMEKDLREIIENE